MYKNKKLQSNNHNKKNKLLKLDGLLSEKLILQHEWWWWWCQWEQEASKMAVTLVDKIINIINYKLFSLQRN